MKRGLYFSGSVSRAQKIGPFPSRTMTGGVRQIPNKVILVPPCKDDVVGAILLMIGVAHTENKGIVSRYNALIGRVSVDAESWL